LSVTLLLDVISIERLILFCIIIETEYGSGNMVSIHGDIYSYGILVLETITGRRPSDSAFQQGLNLREYVNLALQQDRMMDAIDKALSLDLQNVLRTAGDSAYKRKTGCVVSLLRLGMSCTQESPSSRTSTEDIIKGLVAIKDALVSPERTQKMTG
jgi:serine/threonine protein kinase